MPTPQHPWVRVAREAWNTNAGAAADAVGGAADLVNDALNVALHHGGRHLRTGLPGAPLFPGAENISIPTGVLQRSVPQPTQLQNRIARVVGSFLVPVGLPRGAGAARAIPRAARGEARAAEEAITHPPVAHATPTEQILADVQTHRSANPPPLQRDSAVTPYPRIGEPPDPVDPVPVPNEPVTPPSEGMSRRGFLGGVAGAGIAAGAAATHAPQIAAAVERLLPAAAEHAPAAAEAVGAHPVHQLAADALNRAIGAYKNLQAYRAAHFPGRDYINYGERTPELEALTQEARLAAREAMDSSAGAHSVSPHAPSVLSPEHIDTLHSWDSNAINDSIRVMEQSAASHSNHHLVPHTTHPRHAGAAEFHREAAQAWQHWNDAALDHPFEDATDELMNEAIRRTDLARLASRRAQYHAPDRNASIAARRTHLADEEGAGEEDLISAHLAAAVSHERVPHTTGRPERGVSRSRGRNPE